LGGCVFKKNRDRFQMQEQAIEAPQQRIVQVSGDSSSLRYARIQGSFELAGNLPQARPIKRPEQPRQRTRPQAQHESHGGVCVHRYFAPPSFS
jgi:hypothetical protein